MSDYTKVQRFRTKTVDASVHAAKQEILRKLFSWLAVVGLFIVIVVDAAFIYWGLKFSFRNDFDLVITGLSVLAIANVIPLLYLFINRIRNLLFPNSGRRGDR